MTSFEMILNYNFRILFENSFDDKIKFMFAKNNVKNMSQFMNIFKTNLIIAQKQQIKYKNIYTKSKNYEIDFYVMLNDQKIRIRRNKKFERKEFDAFKIIKIYNDRVHKLKLSMK